MKKFLIIYLILFSESAHAYFDPGTGAFIVQAIIAFFAGVAFYLGYPIRLFKRLINKIKNKISKEKKVK